MALRRTGRLGLLALTALTCAACSGPLINRFEVKPQVLCAGEKAVIRWDADGELAMAIQLEPLQKDDPDCAPRGRDVFALTLVATKKGAETPQRVEVVQLQSNAAEPVALHTQSMEGTDMVASDEKNLPLWSSRVEVMTVAACRGRAIQVQHAGKTASLAANGAPSDALSSTALGGWWELRSPLQPDELAKPALRPKELKILTTLRCKPERP